MASSCPTDKEVELSVIIPCLNEVETLGSVLAEAKQFLAQNGICGEIVVGDNGSSDGSLGVAQQAGVRVVHVSQRGYGAALFGAACAAQGKFIIMGDSDGSHDFSAIGPFVEKLREGYDFVMGNRFRGEIVPGAMSWKNRYVGNPMLSGIGRLFFRAPVRDFHCGLRGFTRQAFEKLDLRTTGMEFASEMVIKATLHGLKMTEVPIVMRPAGRSRPAHLRPFRDGWRHLRFMLLYSPRWLFFYPGLFLGLIGGVAVAALTPGPLHIGKLTFDIHSLLYAAVAVLIGAQALTFAVLSKVFGITAGLLPADPRIDRLFRLFRLETGLLLGVVFVGSGLAISLYTVGIWATKYFGYLRPAQLVRMIVPSAVLMAVGLQIILGSFLLSLFGMSRREKRQ